VAEPAEPIKPLDYPPASHILRALGIESIMRSDFTSSAWLPVTPFVAAPWGGVRAGVLATLVDVAGGGLAVRVAQPDWIATADLAVAVVAPAAGPSVEARAVVARRGRTTLVIEVHLYDAPAGGQPASGPPIGWGSMTFAVLPRRETTPTLEPLPDEGSRSAFSWGEATLSVPVADAAGITHVAPAAGRPGTTKLEISEYVHNSLGAVQGGTMALLGDVAGATAVGEAIGAEASTVDLQVSYLALGRSGPIRARTTVLAADDQRGSATVHLFEDDGAGRLATVINVVALAAGAPSARP
jgi:uncharacterized protein (TIGR00369 family)